VQYTVELYKKGEPLGITITGSEDSRLPISIQELSPGNTYIILLICFFIIHFVHIINILCYSL